MFSSLHLKHRYDLRRALINQLKSGKEPFVQAEVAEVTPEVCRCHHQVAHSYFNLQPPVPVIEPLRDPSPGEFEEAVIQDPVPLVEADPVLAPAHAVAVEDVEESQESLAPSEAEEEDDIPSPPENVVEEVDVKESAREDLTAQAGEEAKISENVVEEVGDVEESAQEDSTAHPEPEHAAKEEETMPPAPENVVLSGSTPGPQVALSTSEPATLAETALKDDEES